MSTRRWSVTTALMVVCAPLVGCFESPTPRCGADDLDCFMSHLVVRDATGSAVHVDFILGSAVTSLSMATGASASAPHLTSGPPSLTYPFGTRIDGLDFLFTYRMDLGFADPNGCQPVVGFSFAKNGARSTHTGCFPGLRDHRSSGSFTRSVGFTATAPAGADFDLQMVTISSADCASIDNPINLITANGAVASNPISIPVKIAPPPPPSSSGSSCTAAWDCGSSSQCAAVNGGRSGTAGPFASLVDCNNWRQAYFASAVCSAGCR